MSKTTLRLLKFDPAVALLIMANNHFNLNLRPEFAKVGTPVAVDDDLTEITIESFPSKNDYIRSPYTGSFVYNYHRLRVNEVFGVPVLDVRPPVTIHGILNNISKETGVVFTEEDFENAAVEGDSFILRAKPNSLRWIGQTTVMLTVPSNEVHFAAEFPNNVLDGLYPPNALKNFFDNNILDGLIPPSRDLNVHFANNVLDGLSPPGAP